MIHPGMKLLEATIFKSFLLGCQLLTCNAAFSQSLPTSTPKSSTIQIDNLIQGRVYSPVYSQIKGSQYLNKVWQRGHVNLLGLTYKNLPLWYDIFLDEIILLYETTNSLDLIRLNKQNIDFFTLENRQFINLDYSPYKDLDLKSGYYEVIFEGKVSFLIKRNLSIQYRDALPTFVREDAKYLIKNGIAHRIRGKKSFLQAAGKIHAKQLKTFIKNENISFQRTEEIQWFPIVQYLNTLQSS